MLNSYMGNPTIRRRVGGAAGEPDMQPASADRWPPDGDRPGQWHLHMTKADAAERATITP